MNITARQLATTFPAGGMTAMGVSGVFAVARVGCVPVRAARGRLVTFGLAVLFVLAVLPVARAEANFGGQIGVDPHPINCDRPCRHGEESPVSGDSTGVFPYVMNTGSATFTISQHLMKVGDIFTTHVMNPCDPTVSGGCQLDDRSQGATPHSSTLVGAKQVPPYCTEAGDPHATDETCTWQAVSETTQRFQGEPPGSTPGWRVMAVTWPEVCNGRGPCYQWMSTYYGISNGVVELSGHVTDQAGKPVKGVTVQAAQGGSSQTTQTGADGQYLFPVAPGTYTVTPQLAGASPASRTVTVADATRDVDFSVKQTIVVNQAGNQTDDPAALTNGICDVDPNTAGNQCTLRAAVQVVNAAPGGGEIDFNVPGGGVPSIDVPDPNSPLPALTKPVTIDGTTQPSGKVELTTSATSFVAGFSGLTLRGGDSTVKGMVINRFPRELALLDAGHNTIQQNLLGTDATGDTAKPPLWGNDPTNGHPTATDSDTAEVIRSLRDAGVWIEGSPANQIGGQIAQGNVISGNAGSGVIVRAGDGTVIQGNLIGSGPGTRSHLVGLVAPDPSNPPQQQRVPFVMIGSSHDTVGGSSSDLRNVITGPADLGAIGAAYTDSPGDVIQGNDFLLTELTITSRITVGGQCANPGWPRTPGCGGAGNFFFGQLIVDGSGNVVQGNDLVGSTIVLRTLGPGLPAPANNLIGGASPALGNRVTNCGGLCSLAGFGIPFGSGGRCCTDGLAVPGAPGTTHFEFDTTASAPGGIVLVPSHPFERSAGPHDNQILGNFIQDNGGNGGVVVQLGLNNEIRSNVFSGNRLAINLGAQPYHHNEAEDPQLANHLQHYPKLRPPLHQGTDVTVRGTLDNTAGSGSFRVQFYAQPVCLRDNFEPGQGELLLGEETIHTNVFGGADFSVPFHNFPAGMGAVTTTATDSAGNTSEFSACWSIDHKAPTPHQPFNTGGKGVTDLKVNPESFPAAPTGPTARRPIATATRVFGTQVTYKLNVAARVRFTIERPAAGRRQGRNCTKPSRKNLRGAACTRWVSLPGSFTRKGRKGTNHFQLTGRLNGHTLKPGPYRLTATPILKPRPKKLRVAHATLHIIP
jgi:hypothetical protein